jgi:hypothetical protein
MIATLALCLASVGQVPDPLPVRPLPPPSIRHRSIDSSPPPPPFRSGPGRRLGPGDVGHIVQDPPEDEARAAGVDAIVDDRAEGPPAGEWKNLRILRADEVFTVSDLDVSGRLIQSKQFDREVDAMEYRNGRLKAGAKRVRLSLTIVAVLIDGNEAEEEGRQDQTRRATEGPEFCRHCRHSWNWHRDPALGCWHPEAEGRCGCDGKVPAEFGGAKPVETTRTRMGYKPVPGTRDVDERRRP